MLPLVENLLRRRGIEDFEKFLSPSLADCSRPEDLPGVIGAADAVLDAVCEHHPIVVFGDYDCDGICATAILVRTLTVLGARVEPFLPDRLNEGYGMSEKSVARMLADNPDVRLVVTVDNGINSVEAIAELKSRGVETVVTDHHLPGPELPAALALVNPKVSAPKRLASLCGAGVALLLAQRLINEARRRGIYQGPPIGGPLLVLAGLATVTDIMPLLDDNRILVSQALGHFATWAPIGLRELYAKAARTGVPRYTSKDFGFLLGPRINAAGRMANGLEALELILSDDREITRELARIIEGHNLERKSVEQRMTDEALAKVVEGAKAQVIELPNGHPGVAGIVAARVMEKLGGRAPVCVIAGGHGSARSPEGLNIRDAFVACESVLEKFGGHAAAGGFSVRPGKTDEFRQLLSDYCATHLPESGSADDDLKVEEWIEPKDITLELAEELLQLEPFGEGNPEPVFGLKGVSFADVKPLGAEGRHLSVQLRGCGLRAIAWNRGDQVEDLRRQGSSSHDISFTLAISDYGERHVELRIQSMK